jgi:hypothetical protein
LRLHLLGVTCALPQTRQIAGIDEIHGDWLGFRHAQLWLRLDGE